MSEEKTNRSSTHGKAEKTFNLTYNDKNMN
jgi:hypothetical protein